MAIPRTSEYICLLFDGRWGREFYHCTDCAIVICKTFVERAPPISPEIGPFTVDIHDENIMGANSNNAVTDLI